MNKILPSHLRIAIICCVFALLCFDQAFTQTTPTVTGTMIVCSGGTTTLIATGTGPFAWYDAETGGNLVFDNDTILTQPLTDNTTYWVSDNGGTRKRVNISVVPPPSDVIALQDVITNGASTYIKASVLSGQVNWFTTPTGGTATMTSLSGQYKKVTPTSTTTYYAQAQSLPVNVTFNYTGGVQTFTVPAGVTSINVEAYGAKGRNGSAWGGAGEGGNGGKVQTSMNVTPGQVLYINVGGVADRATPGYNGGGEWQYLLFWYGDNIGFGGAGGGATDIRIGGQELTDRVLVAGGGGGGGDFWQYGGGGGGGLVGGSGGGPYYGIGGSQTEGGTKGCGNYCGLDGAFGIGGKNAVSSSNRYSGAGGGGWYGGGGGGVDQSGGGGGGGSSYTHPAYCSNVVHNQGVNGGHGSLRITYLDNCISIRVPVTVTLDALSHPTVPAPPEAPTYTGTTTFCTVNSTTITAQGAQGASFSWWDAPTAGTLLRSGASYTTPSFNTAGVHHYYVEQAVGGFTSDRTEIVVTVNQTPVINATATPSALCNGSSSTLSASGADTYVWNPGGLTGAPSVTPSATTTYTVTGTTNGCASAPVTATVSVQDISSIANASVCQGSSTTLSTSGADTYVWQPGNLTGSSVSVSPFTTTTYTVTGTHNAFGCTTSKNVTVTVNPVPVLTLMADTTITAGSQALLTASASVSSTFNWASSFTNNPTITGASVVAVPTSTTTYTVTGGTAEGCAFASDQIKITVVPLAIVTGDHTVCDGSTTTLTAAGTGPFTWYNTTTGGSLLHTGASFTTPAITENISYWVSDNGGPRKEVKVSITPEPAASVTSNTICYNDSTYLKNDIISGQTFWHKDSIGGALIDTSASGDSLLISPLTTTTYYAEMESVPIEATFYYTGDVQTFTVPVDVTSIDIEAYGARGRAAFPQGYGDAGGNGGKVQATMNVTPGQVLYIYVGGVGGESNAGYNGGGGWHYLMYWYYYYLGYGGCGGGATDIRMGGQTLNDRVLVAGGGGGGGTYHSTGGAGGGLTGGNGGGVVPGYGGTQTGGGNAGYGSRYYGGNGTQGVGGKNAIFNQTTASGSGGGGWYGGGGGGVNLDENLGGGGGGSSYTNPALFSNVVHAQGVNGSHGSLKISYYDSCTFNSTPITVTVNSCLPTVTTQAVSNISTTTAVGNGTIADLGGPNPTQHGVCWNILPSPTITNSKTEDDGVSTTGAFTSYITGLTSGVTYFVRAYATNDAGTAYGEEVSFTTAGINDIPDDPTFTGTTTLCSGNNSVLTAQGETGATFSWWDAPTAGQLLQIGDSYSTPVFNTGGTYHYYVDQSIGGFTSNRTHVEITVIQTPVITAEATPTTICNGASSSLSALGADTYLWNPGGLTGEPTVSPVVTTTYTVTGTTSGCPSTPVSVTVNVENINNIANVTICSGNSTTLSTSGADSYAWQPGNLTGSSISVSPVTTTTYTVTGTHTVSGCQSVRTAIITVNPTPPAPTLPTNYSVGVGTQVSITASSTGATTYNWTTNFSNYGSLTGTTISYVPASTTTFTVYGVSDLNCPSATSQVTVTVLSIPEVSGPTTVCSGLVTTLTASGTGPFTWYDAETGGNLLYTGEVFTKPALTTNTSYWVSGNGSPRKEVKINVTPAPSNASATSNIICKGTSTYLKTTLSTGLTYWYKDSLTGTLIDSTSYGDSLLVTLDTTTTYYAVMQSNAIDTTFNYTGGLQTFTIPAGVTSIDIEANGAKGRDGSPWGGNGPGGYGGKVQTSMNVTPGQVLNVYIGGAGSYNGGGATYTYYWYGSWLGFGGNGGGATDIRINGQALSDRILVAGGGGGGADFWQNAGGAGGGLVGGTGAGVGPGAGGSQTAGGQGGCSFYCGQSGSYGNGGNLSFNSPDNRYGGSGGGGWFGGGGGGAHYTYGSNGGGGGGGSSYTNPVLCSNVIHTQGVNNGNGNLKISYFGSCTTNSPITVYVSNCYPSVITQNPSSETSATFNGTLTDLGTPNATQHGFCWSTSQVPTIANDKTEEGVPSQTGPFTSQITGLTLNTTYYIRAYAINFSGIVYGNEITYTTPYFNGGGIEIDPYQISNLTDLRYLSEHSSYWNKYFIQTAAIDAKATIDWNGQTGFSPIGTSYYTPFTGQYDGQGYVIDSIYINRNGYDGNYQGLFGYTSGATIKNLGITGANITGSTDIGCLLGNARSTNVSNCYSTGSVSGTSDVGGLVGLFYQSTVSGSYSKATVSGNSNFVGGMVGYNNQSTISDCYSRGAVGGSGTYVGGLTGNNSSYIYRSYSTGTVTGTNYVGGLSGAEGSGNGHFINCYWDTLTSLLPASAGGTGKTTVEMKTKTNFTDAGWDFKGESTNGNDDIWNIGNSRNDGYPYFDWEFPADTFYQPCELITASVSNIAADTATSGGEIIDDGGYSITARGICWSTFQNPTITDTHTTDGSGTGSFASTLTGLETNTTYYVRAYATNAISTFYGTQVSFTTQLFENGTGTAESPFEIATLNDLQILSENSSVWDKYFIQTADIDASPTSGWNSNAGFSPIGTSINYQFTGQYNGQGYYIEGLYINRSASYQGLFGYISGATVENLGITGAHITGTSETGCLVGQAIGNTTVNNCYSKGNVSGSSDVGGLVGNLYQSSVNKSYSIANVTGSSSFIGGLVGYNNQSTISDCYSRGNVGGDGSTVGGLIGSNSSYIYRSYSTGSVSGTSSLGGLSGSDGGGNGHFINCFWDTQTSAQSTSAGGTAKTTVEMNTKTTFTDGTWDFKGENTNGTDEIWNIGNSRNDAYPYFDWEYPTDTFYLPCELTTTAISNMAADTANSGGEITGDGGYSITARGVCWSTSQNPTTDDAHTTNGSGTGSFSSTLTGLETSTTYYVRAYATNAAGTFYGNQQSFTTYIFENGTGASASPFEIATLNDLQTLSENSTVWDKYFIQTANIDASPTSGWNGGAGFSPIGTYNLLPAVTFTGSYNGQGHVINGIYMNRTGTNGYYHGVFGYISGATITNLGVTDANISGTSSIGCLVGNARGNTSISNCYSTGTINGTSSVGGLVGMLYQSSVSKCYSTVAVTGSSTFVGGLIGDNNSSTISDCYSRGNIGGTGDYVGGLAGRNMTSIYRSYSTGTVTGANNRGGLLGSNSGATCVNSFWDTQTSALPTSAGGTGKPTAEMILKATFTDSNWDFKGETSNGTNEIWNIGNGRNDGYPYFDWKFPTDTFYLPCELTTTVISNMAADTATSGGEISGDGGYSITARGVCWSTSQNPTTDDSHTTDGSGTGTFISTLTGLETSTTYYVRAYGTNAVGTFYGNQQSFTTYIFENGTGTPASPFEIANLTDLRSLSENSSVWNKYFIQTADINASPTSTWNSGTGFSPIGTSDFNAFRGNYNGQGYYIDSLYINRNASRQGLFGCAIGATIENTGLKNARITGTSDVGCLLGFAYGTSAVHINNCYSTGSVTGTSSAGGLVGALYLSTMSKSYSKAAVTGSSYYVGGLVGDNNTSNISDCYSRGHVGGSGIYVGGLAGRNSNIYRSYSTGTVSGVSNLGGLLGSNSGTCVNSFWDTQASAMPTSEGGTGKTTAEMNTLSVFYSEGWDFKGETTNGTDDIWNIGNSRNDGYPYFDWEFPGDTTVTLPFVTTATISNTTISTANSGGNVISEGGGSVTSKGICWSTSQNPTTNDTHTNDGSGAGAFVSSLTVLLPGTTYYVRAYATNMFGTSYGEQESFITLPLIPTVTTQAVSNISAIGATGNGNITDLGGPYPTQYGVCWGTSSNPTTSGSKTEEGAASSTGAFTSSITGLIPSTFYYVRAYAINTVGTVYGEEVSFTTLSNVLAVSTQAVTNISGFTATANGTIVNLGVPAQVQHGICWSTTENPTVYDSKTEKGAAITIGPFTSDMTGLLLFTTYYVRVYVINTVDTVYGDEVSFTTLPIAGAVTTQAVTNIQAGRATGNGTITDLGIPNPSQYGVCWNTSSNPTINNYKTQEGTTSSLGAFTSLITGLNPLTTYYVRAYATNEAGTVYGDQVSFTTIFLTGEGTDVSPYEISNLDDLRILSQSSAHWNKYFIQTADIDASPTSTWNNGAGFSPIGTVYLSPAVTFTGNYNGQGYAIDGIYMNRTGTNGYYHGVFGYVSGATISNLGITNANISGTSGVGCLVGEARGSTSVTNCYSSGSVNGGGNVGGLIGTLYQSTLNSSYSTASVSGSSYYPGGLVGDNNSSTINNCYSKGSVSGSGSYGGGLAGRNASGTISKCYSTGTVTTASNNNGFIGGNSGTTANNFWDTQASGVPTGAGATGKTTAEMKTYATFISAGWDFMEETTNGTEDYWGINPAENNGYPFLAWQGYSMALPVILTTQAVSVIRSDSATGNGNISDLGSPEPYQHGVCWSTSTNPTVTDNKTEKGVASSTGAFTSVMTGLTPSTIYYVRAYAINSSGTYYGNEVIFKSLGSPVLTTQSVNNISTSTATIYASVTNSGNPVLSQHGVCWSTSNNPTIADNITIEVPTDFTIDSASATYTSGDISTDYGYQNISGSSTCPVTMSVTIPIGAIITGVNVQYSMTGLAGGYMSEQRSSLKCTSQGGTSETQLYTGVGNSGTYNYNRTGLTIANNVTGGENINFALHAGRTWGGSGCNTTYNKVNNSTWKITVHYKIPAPSFNFTSSLTGLTPYSTYYVKAYAISPIDTAYGNELSFTSGVLWTGASNSNWNTAANWNPGIVPDTNSVVTLPTGANIIISGTTEAEVFDLSISPNSSLSVESNGSLDVRGDLRILSDASGTGSFIDNGTLNVDGEILMQKYLASSNSFGWPVATPVTTAPQNVFDGDINTYFYNPLTPGWEVFATGNMEVMRGYWTKFSTDETLEFTNVLNSGNITYANFYRTAFNSGNYGWNLLGNPYPSAIDWNEVESLPENTVINNSFLETTKLNQAVYISNGNGAYLSFVNGIGQTGFENGFIPPATAFWVQVNNANVSTTNPIEGAQLTFNNTVRVHLNGGTNKLLYDDILRLFLENDMYRDDLVLCFKQESTLGFDVNKDALKMLAENEILPQIYFSGNNEKLSINCISNITESISIPLGVISNVSGQLKITADLSAFDDNISVHLEDISNNVIVDLRQQADYNYQSTNNEDNERFVLHLGLIASFSENFHSSNSENSIYTYNDAFYINLSDNNAVFIIYNMLGQEISRQELSHAGLHKITPQLALGNYIVNLLGTNSSINKKVFIEK